MPFLPPNQQHQSTATLCTKFGDVSAASIAFVASTLCKMQPQTAVICLSCGSLVGALADVHDTYCTPL